MIFHIFNCSVVFGFTILWLLFFGWRTVVASFLGGEGRLVAVLLWTYEAFGAFNLWLILTK